MVNVLVVDMGNAVVAGMGYAAAVGMDYVVDIDPRKGNLLLHTLYQKPDNDFPRLLAAFSFLPSYFVY